MNQQQKKYMILCVAGQSNAVGYDESVIAENYLDQFRRERIAQLGMYGKDNLKVIPLGACAQNYQDMRPYSNPGNTQPNLGTKGIHLPLADQLLDSIPEDYDILVVSCAYGGTGFTVGGPGEYDAERMLPAPGAWRWGVESPYYRGMKDRIAYALEMNPENRFLGTVWIQGENDSEDAAGQAKEFETMTEDFFAYFAKQYPDRVYQGKWDRGIWYNIETVYHWYEQGQCQQIWDHYRAWNPDTYVEIPRDTESNEVAGTGLTARIRACHFGNNAYQKVVAPLTAKVLEKRLKR